MVWLLVCRPVKTVNVWYWKIAIAYGSGPGGGQGPYVFARNPRGGWQMTATAPQPETGVGQAYGAGLQPRI